jgi:ribulose kinase
VEKAGVRPDDVVGISFDGTTHTVVAVDEQGRHLPGPNRS